MAPFCCKSSCVQPRRAKATFASMDLNGDENETLKGINGANKKGCNGLLHFSP